MSKVDRFNGQKLLSTIIAWGSRLLFLAAIIVLSVLSFVDSFNITPQIKNITTMALVAAVLNYLIWDSFYTQQYEKCMSADIKNKDYCIHRRYYEARKGWKYVDLQNKIRQYNEDFKEAWLQDCEDVTGRTRQEIEQGTYKKQSHKFIIWRIKHHKYPKTGIRTPNDLLYILSVGKSDSMRLNVKAEEHYRLAGRFKKILTVIFGCLFIASLTYTFITENFGQAIVTLIMNIAMLFMSLFFGATSGLRGGKLKLSTAEIVSERLEEWKDSKPSEEPYKNDEQKEVKEEIKQERMTVEIR